MIDKHLLITLVSFAFIALAAGEIGQTITRVRMPLITGYLLAGAIAGPFVLDIMHTDVLETLRFVDEMALAFIAFAAGSELYLPELRNRVGSIAWITVGQLVATMLGGTVAFLMLAEHIPFMEELSLLPRLGIAMMGASILIARSPSSAIAIMNEMRAKGQFTKTVLGVTVVMDVAVIVLFAISASLADAFFTSTGFNTTALVFLVLELTIAFVTGFLLGKLLQAVMSLKIDARFKAAAILTIGLGVFVLSHDVREYTHDHFTIEMLLEPLLICMVGSFMVINFSPHRDEFMELLETLGPAVFIVFFTLTGTTLQLDTLMDILPIALTLFIVRLVTIATGAFVGGVISGDPMLHNRLGWMAYITQAGVGLGLAQEVADEFPEFGSEFATLIIAVIVINQVIGPPFLKYAIRRVGEAHLPGTPEPDSMRNAVILGVDGQSLALARQLQGHDWKVIVADTDQEVVERLTSTDVEERWLSEISPDTLAGFVTKATDAFIAMMGSDEENYRACEIVYESFGITRIIVRLNDLSWGEKFQSIGAQVIYPSSAIVHLLDQFVRAPQSATLLLHRDPNHEIIQVTVTDPDVDGLLLRELRLPTDVLILGIIRNGHSIVPHGYHRLQLHDEITLIGEPDSVAEATWRLGY